MRAHLTKYFFLFLLILFAITNIECGNPSRYRLDLYMRGKYGRKLADVENTKFVIQSQFAALSNDIVLQSGNGNTLIATISTHWKPKETVSHEVLAFDEIARFRVYFLISEPVKTGMIALKGNSAAQLSGNYDIIPEKKIYTPVSGSLVIDSINNTHFFSKIYGLYRNIDGDTLRLDGLFKAKYR